MQQWTALYLSKYPEATEPHIFNQQLSADPTDANILGTGADNGSRDIQLEDWLAMDAIAESSTTHTHSAEPQNGLSQHTVPLSRLETLPVPMEPLEPHGEDVQSLQERLRIVSQQLALLEQRIMQPNQQLRAVEAVLGVVWEALRTTGAPQAQPNGTLWNLVMSVAPGAVSSPSVPLHNAASSVVPDPSIEAHTRADAMTIEPEALTSFVQKNQNCTWSDSAYGSISRM